MNAWTIEDYAQLPDDGYRYELIEGDLYMSPAPTTVHQRTLRRLLVRLDAHAVASGAGETFVAPCDVLLPSGGVVQPDLLFVTTEQRDIVGPRNIAGAPNLVVEILSPGDLDHDRVRKHALYARNGVREYWIVDPAARTIDVFVLGTDGYDPAARSGPGDIARSLVLDDFTVAIDDVMPAG